MLWYIRPLSWVIVDNFKVMSFLRVRKQPKKLFFFGEQEDVEIASAVFLDCLSKIRYYLDCINKDNTCLRRSGVYLSQSETSQERNNFTKGFIDGLKEKFAKQVEENNWGLILVPNEEVKRKYNEQVTIKNISFKTSAIFGGSNTGYMDGYNKGINYQQTSGYINN